MRRHLRGLGGLLLVTVLILAAGCGGQRLISRDQEISLGREAGDQFEAQNGGRDQNAEIAALVGPLADRVTAAAEPPDYPYDVRVMKNKEVNAVAFPGGRLYLYRGLIDKFERNPDMIAWVLAHETTHISREHAVRVIERQMGYEVVIGLILHSGNWAQIAGAVSDLMLLSYSRDNEYEADRMGMLYAHAAGYDPTAAVAVLETFQEIQKNNPNSLELMFATHPGNTERLEQSQRYLTQEGWSGHWYTPGGQPQAP